MRESGENPEQTRCCVSPESRCILLPLVAFADWEGATDGMSQKTCKTRAMLGVPVEWRTKDVQKVFLVQT